eukprot:14322183-Alexandrium_andersonii.AAC.1
MHPGAASGDAPCARLGAASTACRAGAARAHHICYAARVGNHQSGHCQMCSEATGSAAAGAPDGSDASEYQAAAQCPPCRHGG